MEINHYGRFGADNPPVAYRRAMTRGKKISFRKGCVARSGRAFSWTPMKWKDVMKLEEGSPVSFMSGNRRMIGSVVRVRSMKTFLGVTVVYTSSFICSELEIRVFFGKPVPLLAPVGRIDF